MKSNKFVSLLFPSTWKIKRSTTLVSMLNHPTPQKYNHKNRTKTKASQEKPHQTDLLVKLNQLYQTQTLM